ncbi:MAG: hypothetical protein JRI58_07070 [Deltaproteobacteria bacterium]|nr:hypothetical protein [Deltaproteobacteria bacterium]MBW2074493.1 hypothetical protein [Deltaproteobacteria bacterium]RLB82643.1 MAG: hypothetical protein DRH17_05215 [Deltaproteobacteria bacterium]
MENLSRDLAQGSQVKKPGHMHKAPRHWTVLLIGDLGKIVSFRLSKPLVLALTVCVTASLSIVIYWVVSYNSVCMENTQLKKELDTLTAGLKAAEREREKALVRLMVLEGKAEQTDEAPAATVQEPTADKPEGEEGAKSVGPVSPAPAPETRETVQKVSPGPARMSVENFKIRQDPEDNALKCEFLLRNIDPQGMKISGHTFVVLNPKEGSGESPKAFPWTPLKDGRPTLFQRGQRFSIARFMVVHGTLTGVSAIDRFTTATVYVYANTGDLLVEKVFEVDKVFES